MDKYTRKCPRCEKELSYSTKFYRDECEKKGRMCPSCGAKARIEKHGNNVEFLKYTQPGACVGEANPFFGKKHTEKTKLLFKQRDLSYRKERWYKKLMSEAVKGEKNPMHGKSVYQTWVKKYGEEQANSLYDQWVSKQRANSTGDNNPMYGRPAPQGSGNGWSGWYKKVYFRSLRELAYMVNLDKEGIKWRSAEKIGITYTTDWDGLERTYHPDFIVGNRLVEIKPKRLHGSRTVQLKKKAAEEYCSKNNLVYELIDPEPLPVETIKELRNNGTIVFTERYEQRFEVYLTNREAKNGTGEDCSQNQKQ